MSEEEDRKDTLVIHNNSSGCNNQSACCVVFQERPTNSDEKKWLDIKVDAVKRKEEQQKNKETVWEQGAPDLSEQDRDSLQLFEISIDPFD